VSGYMITRITGRFVGELQLPGAGVLAAAAAALVTAGIGAALVPAIQAAATNIVDSLRAE
jgi:isoaspartyl peptidase/L-asparaginase-like protein (Ntn-hydrolase superfamily)